MRHGAVLLCLLLVGLPGLARALDRQGMGTIGGSLGGVNFLGTAPSLSSDARTRLSFRAHSKYILNEKFRITGSAGYAWNSYKGTYDPGTKETLDTLLIITPVELGLEYSFGPDFNASRPYVGVQAGLYRWEFVSNQPFGVRGIVQDNHASASMDKAFFGMGANLGEEYFWRDNASVSVELGIHHIAAKASSFPAGSFAPRFAKSLNMAEARVGMSYYFSVAPSSGQRQSVGPAIKVDTSAAAAKATTIKPEIQKESIQISPDAVDPDAPKGKPQATPVSPTPTPAPAPVPIPDATPPAPAATPSAPAATPPAPAPAVTPPAPAASDSSAAPVPPPAVPSDTTSAKPR